MTRSRFRASVLAAVAALGTGTIGAAPAQAADLGTITVTGASDPYSYSPITLTGAVGDTFRVVNATTTTPAITVSVGTTVGVDTGLVSVGATPCDPVGTQGTCIAASSPGTTYTITRLGTISITHTGAPGTPIGPILLQAAEGGGVTDPKLVYPTAYINANGGTCTGTLEFTKYNGQNGTITTPTSTTCSRTNYTLGGWARSASALRAEWAPGTTVPIGDESFTLYAVWAANGVEVTYDANVGLATPCLAAGVDLPTAAERRSTTVVTAASSGQAVSVGADGTVRWTAATPAPPCSPAGFTLAGWSTTPTGSVRAGGQANDTVTSGGGIPSSGRAAPGADRLTLYAVWSAPTYGISLTASSMTLEPGDFATVTAIATVNGSPAANVSIAVSVPTSAPFTLANGATSALVTTSASGEASLAVIAKSGDVQGNAAITAAYGNKTAAVNVTVASALTIVITGERTTVSGKPGIRVEGVTTGLPARSTVIPYFRFLGEPTFTQASARPVVDANGEFFWERKTGKKSYVYFETASGAKSNRVIIAAN
ncbi:MAG: InlB B-repeat-containing protein [Actinomycetota bacterium]